MQTLESFDELLAKDDLDADSLTGELRAILVSYNDVLGPKAT